MAALKTTTEVVSAFARAVAAAWPSVMGIAGPLDDASRDTFVADWLQASWETLVESALSTRGEQVFLEVYGEGADCNASSSRVYRPEVVPTAAIVCVPRPGHVVVEALTQQVMTFPPGGLAIDRLVRLDGAGWYDASPPFDHVLLVGGTDQVLPLGELEFQLAFLRDRIGGRDGSR